MQASNVPVKFPIPFANAAGASYIRQVPTPSQIGAQDGAASLTDGFPPDCGNLAAAGGVPPFMQDFNGVLFQATGWDRWFAAGGPVTYDASFQSSIGGYPAGARVQSAVTLGLYWISTVDNNMTNPDAAGAGWENDYQFGQGANGYYVFPGGLIVQWGNFSTPSTISSGSYSTTTVNFPITFPNACWVVVGNFQSNVPAGVLGLGGGGAAATRTGFKAGSTVNSGGLPDGCYFIAIGN